MRNRSRPNASLVRERGAFEALDQCPDHTACNAEARERARKDLTKGPTDLIEVHQDDDQCDTDIHQPHKRNDFFGYFRDRLEATHDNSKHDTGKDNASDPTRVVAQNVGQLRMRLVGLEHVTAAQRAEDTEDREQHSQDTTTANAAFGKAFGEVVHRATRNRAVFVFVSVLHAERTFGEF